MPTPSTVSICRKPLPQLKALKRAEDAIRQDPYQRLQSDQCILARALEAARQHNGFSSTAEFTQSLPKIGSFSLNSYLATPDTEGPFEIQACGYFATELPSTKAADAYALDYTEACEFAEVLNAKKEVIASYFDPSTPYWTYVVEGYDDSADKGMEWFVHMRLSMAEMSGDVRTFASEAEVYQYAEEILSDSNVFTGQQALVVAKLDLDEFGRLLKHPETVVALVYQYGDVFECHESAPEAFKQAHPICSY